MNWRADLSALRDGGLTFDTFATRHGDRFHRWARYFFERWPQRAIGADDLAQEAMIEAWQAVDKWDPSRGVPIDRFVEYRVGERMTREIHRVNGWPRKDRGTRAPSMVSLQDVGPGRCGLPDSHREEDSRGENAAIVIDAVDKPALDPVVVLDRDRVISGLSNDRLAQLTAAGVALGMNIRVMGVYIYQDDDMRKEFRFTSQEHAIREVRKKVRRTSRKLDQVVR